MGFFDHRWQFDAKRSDLLEPLLNALQMSWVYRTAIKTAQSSVLLFSRDEFTNNITLEKQFQLKDSAGSMENIVMILCN